MRLQKVLILHQTKEQQEAPYDIIVNVREKY